MDSLKKKIVFQTDSEFIKQALKQDNYLIEYSENNEHNEKYCVIYFSSHNIYYPNTEEVFTKNIIQKNRLEWYGSRIEKGSKHIFIRDIQKQWYLKGINNKINSIEKLAEFLKAETEGYKTIMLGSSAGGYAAVLFGSILNVEYMLSFNGQFQMYDILERSNELTDPIVFRQKDNIVVNKYYSLKSFIKSPNKVFYFHSNKSNWDITNKRHIEGVGLNTLSFKTKNHGIPFVRSALSKIINMSYNDLNRISNKKYNPIIFSFRHGGVIPTMQILYRKLILKWK
jgi:hypothetical protein